MTFNDRLDYFGQAVNIASRIQSLAQAEEIYLSEEIHDYPGVEELLEPFTVERRMAQLKGVNLEVPVFRVSPRTAPELRPGNFQPAWLVDVGLKRPDLRLMLAGIWPVGL